METVQLNAFRNTKQKAWFPSRLGSDDPAGTADLLPLLRPVSSSALVPERGLDAHVQEVLLVAEIPPADLLGPTFAAANVTYNQSVATVSGGSPFRIVTAHSCFSKRQLRGVFGDVLPDERLALEEIRYHRLRSVIKFSNLFFNCLVRYVSVLSLLFSLFLNRCFFFFFFFF